MPTPVEILKHEHRIIERVLRALGGLSERLKKGESVSPEALSSFLDFIGTFADRCHHGKEETHLFPTLEQRGIPREGGPIGVMLHEHELGRGLVAELARAADAYGEGDRAAGPQFAEIARQYIELLTQHIQKEDNILFQMAEQVLDEETKARLERAFQQEEEELGAGTHEHFERVATTLEETWAT